MAGGQSLFVIWFWAWWFSRLFFVEIGIDLPDHEGENAEGGESDGESDDGDGVRDELMPMSHDVSVSWLTLA